MRDYTTGRAARELKVSQTDLRALCQAGLIAARATTGGHWRIPKGEVQRLRREGLPDLPSPALEDSEAQAPGAPLASGHPHPSLLSAPGGRCGGPGVPNKSMLAHRLPVAVVVALGLSFCFAGVHGAARTLREGTLTEPA
jgi:excisionase family DNA binding protein